MLAQYDSGIMIPHIILMSHVAAMCGHIIALVAIDSLDNTLCNYN